MLEMGCVHEAVHEEVRPDAFGNFWKGMEVGKLGRYHLLLPARELPKTNKQNSARAQPDKHIGTRKENLFCIRILQRNRTNGGYTPHTHTHTHTQTQTQTQLTLEQLGG